MFLQQTQTFVKNVRQWRDFLDVLLFCRQNNCNIAVAPNHPQLIYLVELQNNFKASSQAINDAYSTLYKDVRAYKGEFTDVSSQLVIKKLIIANSRGMIIDTSKKLLSYGYTNKRSEYLEAESEFLALVDTDGDTYLGTKIYMRKNMIELLSL